MSIADAPTLAERKDAVFRLRLRARSKGLGEEGITEAIMAMAIAVGHVEFPDMFPSATEPPDAIKGLTEADDMPIDVGTVFQMCSNRNAELLAHLTNMEQADLEDIDETRLTTGHFRAAKVAMFNYLRDLYGPAWAEGMQHIAAPMRLDA